mmetsp:Transcript_55620/g.143274  ORF Transcript_55620/g.143274 Transcript_55620/m.143274 type:complete len:514 (-) Transcript_55620:288-1829(-)
MVAAVPLPTPRSSSSCSQRRAALGDVKPPSRPSSTPGHLSARIRKLRGLPLPAEAPVQSARLPASIRSGIASKAPLPADPASSAYQWTPVYVRMDEPACAAKKDFKNLASFGAGCYVNTLTMNIRKETYNAAAHLFQLDRERWIVQGGRPWVYRLRGSIPFIICNGVVVLADTSETDSGKPLVIGKLPEGLRPGLPLRFAALARQRTVFDSTSSKLVSLVALPSGLLTVEAGPGGQGALQPGCTIDLSAVRFCIGNGISLIDDLRCHICDVGGTRLVCLQGTLAERRFVTEGRKHLALLPESCQPQAETAFVVAGENGGFHLLSVRPHSSVGDTGDVIWRDSKWNRDVISLNGVMFEVSPKALANPNPMIQHELTEGVLISLVDFQKYLKTRFGNIQNAWTTAFDTDQSGAINFTEFGLGCKAAGYVGSPTRLWSALDEDLSGEISVEELSMPADQKLAQLHQQKRVQQETQGGKPKLKSTTRLSLSLASTRAPTSMSEMLRPLSRTAGAESP